MFVYNNIILQLLIYLHSVVQLNNWIMCIYISTSGYLKNNSSNYLTELYVQNKHIVFYI